jgi:hypothetical protein
MPADRLWEVWLSRKENTVSATAHTPPKKSKGVVDHARRAQEVVVVLVYHVDLEGAMTAGERDRIVLADNFEKRSCIHGSRLRRGFG